MFFYFNINVIVKCLAVKPAGYLNLTEMSLVSFILIYRYKQSDTWLAKNLLCLIYKFAWLMYLIYYKYFIFLNFSALTKLANSIVTLCDFFFACVIQILICAIYRCIFGLLQESNFKTEGLKTKVDLGCNFYVQAHV